MSNLIKPNESLIHAKKQYFNERLLSFNDPMEICKRQTEVFKNMIDYVKIKVQQVSQPENKILRKDPYPKLSRIHASNNIDCLKEILEVTHPYTKFNKIKKLNRLRLYSLTIQSFNGSRSLDDTIYDIFTNTEPHLFFDERNTIYKVNRIFEYSYGTKNKFPEYRNTRNDVYDSRQLKGWQKVYTSHVTFWRFKEVRDKLYKELIISKLKNANDSDLREFLQPIIDSNVRIRHTLEDILDGTIWFRRLFGSTSLDRDRVYNLFFDLLTTQNKEFMVYFGREIDRRETTEIFDLLFYKQIDKNLLHTKYRLLENDKDGGICRFLDFIDDDFESNDRLWELDELTIEQKKPPKFSKDHPPEKKYIFDYEYSTSRFKSKPKNLKRVLEVDSAQKYLSKNSFYTRNPKRTRRFQTVYLSFKNKHSAEHICRLFTKKAKRNLRWMNMRITSISTKRSKALRTYKQSLTKIINKPKIAISTYMYNPDPRSGLKLIEPVKKPVILVDLLIQFFNLVKEWPKEKEPSSKSNVHWVEHAKNLDIEYYHLKKELDIVAKRIKLIDCKYSDITDIYMKDSQLIIKSRKIIDKKKDKDII